MKFPSKQLILVSAKKIISKKNNELIFIKVADPSTYENEDFLLGNETDILKYNAGDVVEAQINIENKFTTMNFI